MASSEMEMFGGERVTVARDVGKKVFSHSTVEDPVRLAVRWRKHPVGPPSQILNTTLMGSVQILLEESIGSSTLDCPKPIFTAPYQCMEARKDKTLSPEMRPTVFSVCHAIHGSSRGYTAVVLHPVPTIPLAHITTIAQSQRVLFSALHNNKLAKTRGWLDARLLLMWHTVH